MNPVLVVDDKHDILSFIRYELKPDGINTFEADNVSDAIAALRSNEFSCILLDIFIKEESSEEVIKFLKSDENTLNSSVPIIIMSGMINEDFINRNASKVYKILEKPFGNGEILETIRAISIAG